MKGWEIKAFEILRLAFSRAKNIQGIGKDPGMNTAEDVQIGFDPIDAWLADIHGEFFSRRLMVKAPISDDSDPRRGGNGNFQFCGVTEDKLIAQHGPSSLLCQEHGKSGGRSVIIEGDIHSPFFQGVEQCGHVGPAVSRQRAFSEDVCPDQAEDPRKGEKGEIQP